jgi:hypothetical protein
LAEVVHLGKSYNVPTHLLSTVSMRRTTRKYKEVAEIILDHRLSMIQLFGNVQKGC